MKTRNFPRLFDWMDKRHAIFLERSQGGKWPWTKDPIMQQYSFCNVFRQLDRTTVDMNRQVYNSNPKRAYKEDKYGLFFRICLYRTFNLPSTYSALKPVHNKWSAAKAKKILKELDKVFTGAYMMTGRGTRGDKAGAMVDTLSRIHKDRQSIVDEIEDNNLIEVASDVLQRYAYVGKFLSYEFATDLRHTPILWDAEDIYTWANAGPGATRGLNRLADRPLLERVPAAQTLEEMQQILTYAKESGYPFYAIKPYKLELRDIEHSLCELDKYERARLGQGTPKNKYRRPENV